MPSPDICTGSWEKQRWRQDFPSRHLAGKGAQRAGAEQILGSKHSLPLTQQQGCHPWRAATSDRAVISQQSRRGAHPPAPSVLPSPGRMEVPPVSCAQGISLSLPSNSRRQQGKKEGEHSKAQKSFHQRHTNCSHFESEADLPCFHQHFSCFSIGMKCWHKREKRVEISQRKVQNRARCQFTIRH